MASEVFQFVQFSMIHYFTIVFSSHNFTCVLIPRLSGVSLYMFSGNTWNAVCRQPPPNPTWSAIHIDMGSYIGWVTFPLFIIPCWYPDPKLCHWKLKGLYLWFLRVPDVPFKWHIYLYRTLNQWRYQLHTLLIIYKCSGLPCLLWLAVVYNTAKLKTTKTMVIHSFINWFNLISQQLWMFPLSKHTSFIAVLFSYLKI